MSYNLKELISAIPDAIASPFTQWHQDEINREIALQTNYYNHVEYMQQMEYDHQKEIANRLLATEYLKTLQIAMETGNLDRALGEGLQRVPLLLD